MNIKELVALIDESLELYRHREVVTAREHNDILLDLRLACTRMPEQGGTDGALIQEGVAAVAGADPGPS